MAMEYCFHLSVALNLAAVVIAWLEGLHLNYIDIVCIPKAAKGIPSRVIDSYIRRILKSSLRLSKDLPPDNLGVEHCGIVILNGVVYYRPESTLALLNLLTGHSFGLSKRKGRQCGRIRFLIAKSKRSSRIDKLKKTIAAFEVDIKEKLRHIEEKERDLAKTQKALEEQKEAKKKSDGVITVLESQLQEKNEQIRNYELELSETEELRKTIMSLMESKKPKRK
ncbi:hypothetical protein FF38_00379 [Lucilia cuprina]|uniref:Uncharacterized protein n=1 Tax=Lucilia cuprina TaxID=7375 RepID=A0A0L0BSB5_LUCCU|nr:hypothetical protein FF38_00379 [Lucilia cuprina]